MAMMPQLQELLPLLCISSVLVHGSSNAAVLAVHISRRPGRRASSNAGSTRVRSYGKGTPQVAVAVPAT